MGWKEAGVAMAVLMSEAETADCVDCAADLDLYGASWPRPVCAGSAPAALAGPATATATATRPALWLVPDRDQGWDRDRSWDRDGDRGWDVEQGWDRDRSWDRDGDRGWDRLDRLDRSDEAGRAAPPMVRAGVDVARRRARRAIVRRRRRAVVIAAVAAGLVCGLALPLSSLAGSPVTAHLQAQPVVAGETVYVVRPGDTLWSIAARLDHGGNPRAMAEALAAETGSAVVVPGERIPIP